MTPAQLPHEFHHQHADVTGGWLRAATFGAMDGLVSNTALIAGVAASAGASAVVVSGVAGLLAGAFSMALGEYTSVTTANEQIDSEVRVEKRAFRTHRDEQRALNFHLVQELGVDPTEKPSPRVAAGSSFFMFAVGAIIPLIPYLLGFESLVAGLVCGGIGLLVAGGLAARFTKQPVWFGSARQLAFGGMAIAATYVVGSLIGGVV